MFLISLSTWSNWWPGLVGRVILRLFPFQHFFPRALLHGKKLGVGWWVSHVIIVSALIKDKIPVLGLDIVEHRSSLHIYLSLLIGNSYLCHLFIVEILVFRQTDMCVFIPFPWGLIELCLCCKKYLDSTLCLKVISHSCEGLFIACCNIQLVPPQGTDQSDPGLEQTLPTQIRVEVKNLCVLAIQTIDSFQMDSKAGESKPFRIYWHRLHKFETTEQWNQNTHTHTIIYKDLLSQCFWNSSHSCIWKYSTSVLNLQVSEQFVSFYNPPPEA